MEESKGLNLSFPLLNQKEWLGEGAIRLPHVMVGVCIEVVYPFPCRNGYIPTLFYCITTSGIHIPSS